MKTLRGGRYPRSLRSGEPRDIWPLIARALHLPPKEVRRMAVLNAAQHRRFATITEKKPGHKPQGRFPMPDKEHARLALQMLPRAKGLSDADKEKIRARANAKLGKKGMAKRSALRSKRKAKGDGDADDEY